MPNSPTTDSAADRIIVRGVHLDLTPALRAAAIEKADRLFRHDDRIIRCRIELELDRTRTQQEHFIAKGRLEIRGPDLLASASSEDAYKSLDLLMDKLDELLRRRHQKRVNSRNDERRQLPTEALDEQ